MKTKNIILTLFALLLFASTQAQAPLGIPYQAAARHANGQAITNTAIKVRFSILDSTATGTIAFKEQHTTTTNALGMFNLNIGMGIANIGSMSDVNWGNNAKFLKVELDTTATGNNYMLMGMQQLMSVPYALQANNANTANTAITALKLQNKYIAHDTSFFSKHLIGMFTSPYSFVVPENVFSIKIIAVGGGSSQNIYILGSALNEPGGSGAYIKTILSVQCGDSVKLIPGVGGVPDTTGQTNWPAYIPATSGSASSIYINSQLIISAGGGAGSGGGNYIVTNGIKGVFSNGRNATLYNPSSNPQHQTSGKGWMVEDIENVGGGAELGVPANSGNNGIIYIEY